MKVKEPGAHIDQLLRQTRMHHVQLSSMADVKANMMFTVASLVVTLSVRYVTDPRIQWAAITLIGFCLATIVLAAYAVMPKVPLFEGPKRKVDLTSPSFNLLFFGDFTRMSYPEFEAAMEGVLNDAEATYEVMVREVYTLGVFLARKKYRFVRLAYLTFIAGLFVSGVVLLAAELGR